MANESALLRQLKKLSVPQTTVLIQNRIRKSLLFDHRDAAGLDRDLIFSYGTNGLEKLCIINPLFSKFQKTLFSSSYKEFERSIQTSSVNSKLDEKITDFLRMLSPYFLLRASHEALEWLIYRYHIHMYNIDALISSAIPYYNTTTFVKVVLLLDLDERNRWFWLKSIQKSGVPLNYAAIVNRFNSDAGFRKFICDIAPNMLHVYENHENAAIPVISFSMLTISNALYKCEIDDKLVVSLFPYILKGISSNNSKYTAASYIIISQIMTKVKLSSEIVDTLLNKLFDFVKDELMKEICEITLLVFQNQVVKSLPKKLFNVLLSNDEYLSILSELVDKFDASVFLRAVVKKSVKVIFNIHASKNKEALVFFKKFMNAVKWDKKSVSLCFCMTLRKYSRCLKGKKNKTIRKQCKKVASSLLKNLEMKYSNNFDLAYKKFLKKKCSNMKMLCRLITNSICNMQYKMLPNMETSLVLGLNHSNPQIRQTSVSYLLDVAKDSSDKSFIQNSIYERLNDDCPGVVSVLISNPDVLLEHLSNFQILNSLQKILNKKIKKGSKWYHIQMTCLEFIINNFSNEEYSFDFLETIAPFVFPINNHNVDGFLKIINSKSENLFIKNLKSVQFEVNEEMTNDNFFEITNMVLASVKEYVSNMSDDMKVAYISHLVSKISIVNCNSFAFSIYVMQFIILGENKEENLFVFISALLQVFQSYICKPNIKFEHIEDISEESHFKKCIQSLNKGIFSISHIYFIFYKIISKLQLKPLNRNWPLEEEGLCCSYKVLTCLFEFCVLQINSKKEVLREWFKIILSRFFACQFKNIKDVFWFLSMKWINDSKDIAYVVQLNSINIAAFFCTQEDMSWIFDDDVIFLCLLRTIAHPDHELSSAALNTLSSIISSIKDYNHPYKCLSEAIIENAEEIRIDYSQCFECISKWLEPAFGTTDMSCHLNDTKTHSADVLQKLLDYLNRNEVPHSIKQFLLLCLQNIDNNAILSSYIPVLYSYLKLIKIATSTEHLLSIVELLLKKFTPNVASYFTESSEEIEALFYCLNFEFGDSNRSVQILTLNVLNKEFFSAIKHTNIQQKIFDNLLDLYLNSPTHLNNKVEKVLRKLCTFAYLYLGYFQSKKLDIAKTRTLREAKKSRISYNTSDNANVFENDLWKKITVFLELMQNKSQLQKPELLIPELFNLLNKSLDFESQPQVEYVKQLILSAIYTCCKQLNSNDLDERHFQVELIVQCIRSSMNPKTHHQSLLLLNLAATVFPDYVLTNVMSIFTFMGSSLIRQDDSYSFQIISQTIETIVPSLLEASNQQTETDSFQVVASVIRVFVDSLSDIPGHRQLPLFTKLISTLDPSKYLWIPLSQICEQCAITFHDIDIAIEGNNSKIPSVLEFAVNLHKHFSPIVQIDTCNNLIEFLSKLPSSKDEYNLNPDMFQKFKEPFNIINHTDKQLQLFKYHVLSYIKIWLSSQAFLSQVSELDTTQMYNLEEKYELLLENVLSLLQKRLNTLKWDKIAIKADKLMNIIYDLINAINSLLPCKLFIRIIRRLLRNNEQEIQIKAVELLNSKLEQQELQNEENYKSLLKLLKPLWKLIINNLDDQKQILVQDSLYALHLLIKLIGSTFPTKFYKVLNISVTVLNKSNNPELIINALICLSELCNCLNVDILPHLNSFMPVIINILKNKELLNMNDNLILGIITTLESVIHNLGVFLSSYIQDILTSICLFSAKYTELGKKIISEKLLNLQTKLANEIDLRIILNSAEESYLKCSQSDVNSIFHMMNILTSKLNSTNYEEILSCSSHLQKFYISLLDFRNNNPLLSSDTTAIVENSIISSLHTFVIKLSVTRFRTFFQKIYQWATITDDDHDTKYRIFTFYKLTTDFSKSLKNLFSHMAKYFFRHAASVLESSNITKSKIYYFDSNLTLSYELLVNILDTLNNCFIYCDNQLLDKENFELLMQPLVDQIENLIDEKFYQQLIENHLNSCIASFMCVVSDNALWKQLNYQILLKTRHDSPKVRFAALQVIQEVVKKMGDNYLVLLPESIPFLAEIMEDESSEVEQECQNVIIEMENILGEPIRKYF